MKRDVDFWMTVLARGLVALLAGSAILIVPDMARTILLLPIAVAVAVAGLAGYGIFDSALIFISSFMAQTTNAKIALRVQGLIGVAIGLLLLSVLYNQVRLEWFLSLAALQALTAGFGETVVARHTTNRAASHWNYSAAVIAFISAAVYGFIRIRWAEDLTPRALSWAVYMYLLAFGIAQCLTAARMLYTDREALSSSSSTN
jgi:undecaprenyl pyrophosphate phosphatase UppP